MVGTASWDRAFNLWDLKLSPGDSVRTELNSRIPCWCGRELLSAGETHTFGDYSVRNEVFHEGTEDSREGKTSFSSAVER